MAVTPMSKGSALPVLTLPNNGKLAGDDLLIEQRVTPQQRGDRNDGDDHEAGGDQRVRMARALEAGHGAERDDGAEDQAGRETAARVVVSGEQEVDADDDGEGLTRPGFRGARWASELRS